MFRCDGVARLAPTQRPPARTVARRTRKKKHQITGRMMPAVRAADRQRDTRYSHHDPTDARLCNKAKQVRTIQMSSFSRISQGSGVPGRVSGKATCKAMFQEPPISIRRLVLIGSRLARKTKKQKLENTGLYTIQPRSPSGQELGRLLSHWSSRRQSGAKTWGTWDLGPGTRESWV